MDYSSNHALVNYRVEQLAYQCVKAVHQNRLVVSTQFKFFWSFDSFDLDYQFGVIC